MDWIGERALFLRFVWVHVFQLSERNCPFSVTQWFELSHTTQWALMDSPLQVIPKSFDWVFWCFK